MKPSRVENPDVVIVGGGPCGLFAGLLLARRGVRCAIFERHATLSTHPKAMGISHRTAELFRQTGLLGELERGSLSLEGRDLAIWSKSLSGEVLGRTPFSEIETPLSPCRSMHCPQTWTEHTLAGAIKHEPKVSLEFGIEVRSVENHDSHASVTLADGTLLETSWVLAADGAGSHIRKQLEIGTDGPGDLGHFVNTLFRANYGPHLDDRKAVMYQALGRDFFEFFVAVNGSDLWLMHHFLQPGETPEDFQADQLRDIIQMASGLPDVPVEVLGTSPWVMSPKVAKRWRDGRILLGGDAAARLSPAGGLGLNNGLQSIHNLAWKLASVVREGAPSNLLDTYESERRPCALRLMQNTNKNAEEIFAIVAAGMRGDWAAARDGIAHSRRAGSGLGQDLGQAYDEGAFLPDNSAKVTPKDPINDYLPSGRPGERAPHLPITQAADKSSLLDLFGDGFVVLAGKAGGAWRTPGLEFFQNGAEFECPDFEDTYGISSAGCVLVRPDGYIAARFPDATKRSDLRAVKKSLMGD
jgi:2-polyprenyl-6-methoxyphenol hydroxylase-like FAD-dependent oxidoreductase